MRVAALPVLARYNMHEIAYSLGCLLDCQFVCLSVCLLATLNINERLIYRIEQAGGLMYDQVWV